MCEERARVVEPAGVGLLRLLAVGLSLRECDSSVAAISCCLEIHAAVGRLQGDGEPRLRVRSRL